MSDTIDSLTDAELTAAIEGTGEVDEGSTERPAFVIDDAGKADWLLRKLAAVKAEKELIRAQAAQMIAQLDADAKALEGFVPQLREWGAQELQRRGGRRKTLPLFTVRLPIAAFRPGCASPMKSPP